jgi:zinc protease
MNRASRANLAAWFAIATFALAPGLVSAQTGSGAPKQIATVEGITEYRLDNGLRVLLFPDQSRP